MPKPPGSSPPATILLDAAVSRRIKVHVLVSPDERTSTHHTYLEDALHLAGQNGWTRVILHGYEKSFLIQLLSTSAAKEPYKWEKSPAHS